ncbi:MAG TPA: hypothetical protein VGN14_16325 [Candidatus Elarobacter sp.]
MARHFFVRASALIAAALFLSAAAPARADDFLKNVIFTVQPQYTAAVGSDTIVPRNGLQLEHGNPPTTHGWELNYSARWLASRKFNVLYSHSTLDQALDAFNAYLGIPLTTGGLRDRFDTVAINNTPNAHLIQTLSYVHRTRMCCPADSETVVGPPDFGGVDQTDYRFGETYRFGPRTIIGYPFTVFATAAYTNHPFQKNYTPATMAANGGTPYSGSGFNVPSYGARIDVPTWDRTFIPFVQYSQGGTFYRKDPGMYLYRFMQYGFTKVLTKNITFSTYDFTAQQYAGQSYLTARGHDSIREALWISQLNYSFKL